jgi:hypothetical protein
MKWDVTAELSFDPLNDEYFTTSNGRPKTMNDG